MEEVNFGKSPKNPIKVKGIDGALIYLHSLLTDDNKPFLFHRIRSMIFKDRKPIDCYEIIKSNHIIDYLFIDIYSGENSNSVPIGYVMHTQKANSIVINGIEVNNTIGVNYRIKNFPNALLETDYAMPFLNPQSHILLELLTLRTQNDKTAYYDRLFDALTGVMKPGLIRTKPPVITAAIEILIAHFESLEAYEKCATLQKLGFEIFNTTD